MDKRRWLACAAVALALMGSGCAHTRVSQVGLISFGNLEGKTIPKNPEGPMLEGSSSATVGPDNVPTLVYFLSDAARDALKNTEYDTLVDVDVTAKTGFMPDSNLIIVRGRGLNSAKLPQAGGAP